MSGKIIPIDTKESKFFRQLLDLMKSFHPIKGLRNKELDLLAVIMEENHKNRHLDKESRRDLIFSRGSRTRMQTKLDMASPVFNNNLSLLRKHKILNRNNMLKDFLDIHPEKSYTFTVEFKIKSDGKNEA